MTRCLYTMYVSDCLNDSGVCIQCVSLIVSMTLVSVYNVCLIVSMTLVSIQMCVSDCLNDWCLYTMHVSDCLNDSVSVYNVCL